MLKDDFYKILSLNNNQSAISVVIELNAEHDIFKGHFPETPVVPGVCMMQMVKELVALATGKNMLLAKADSIKFLVVVDPRVNRILKIDVVCKWMNNAVDVDASLSFNETICFKFKGTFIDAI